MLFGLIFLGSETAIEESRHFIFDGDLENKWLSLRIQWILLVINAFMMLDVGGLEIVGFLMACSTKADGQIFSFPRLKL